MTTKEMTSPLQFSPPLSPHKGLTLWVDTACEPFPGYMGVGASLKNKNGDTIAELSKNMGAGTLGQTYFFGLMWALRDLPTDQPLLVLCSQECLKAVSTGNMSAEIVRAKLQNFPEAYLCAMTPINRVTDLAVAAMWGRQADPQALPWVQKRPEFLPPPWETPSGAV